MSKEAAKGAIEVVRGAAGAGDDAEQLDMLMPPTRSSMTARETERVEKAIKSDRRGRPPGARNVATREMLEFVRKTMGDPLLERFRWATHTPETLSIVLGCTKLEAFDRIDKIRADLAQYFYAKQAQVDGAGNAVAPILNMVFGGPAAPAIGADGAPRPPWLYGDVAKTINAETQQNQALLASPIDVSHGDVSHDEDNASDISDLEP